MPRNITLDKEPSRRFRDDNGYLIIRNNPIAKSGVFEYTGVEVGNDAAPNKMFQVYRSFDELLNAKDKFEGMPILLQHEWIDPENPPKIRGTVSGAITAEEPYLKADLKIMDAETITAIESGEITELSPGYYSKYEEKSGEHNQQKYELIQKDLKFNHLALVAVGRSGKDLRVLDHKIGGFNKMARTTKKMVSDAFGILRKALDSIAEKKEENADAGVDKRELIREITAIATKPDSDFKGGEDEKFETILKMLEKASYSPSEAEKTNGESGADKTADSDIATMTGAFKEFARLFEGFLKEEGTEPAHTVDNDKKTTQDSRPTMDSSAMQEIVRKAMDEKDKQLQRTMDAYEKVSPYTGAFSVYRAGAAMSANDVYAHGLECISGRKMQVQDAESAFNAYLAAKTADKGYSYEPQPVFKDLDDLTSHIK